MNVSFFSFSIISLFSKMNIDFYFRNIDAYFNPVQLGIL